MHGPPNVKCDADIFLFQGILRQTY